MRLGVRKRGARASAFSSSKTPTRTCPTLFFRNLNTGELLPPFTLTLSISMAFGPVNPLALTNSAIFSFSLNSWPPNSEEGYAWIINSG